MPSTNRPPCRNGSSLGTGLADSDASRANGQEAALIGVFFLGGSTLFAVLAFQNFSPLIVSLLQLTLAAGPLTLIILGSSRGGRLEVRDLLGRVARAGGGALGLVSLQLVALVVWRPYFTNYAYARLDSGGGYHRDSAFHVAIIQNILSRGRPSTGQHLEPFLPYHILSYYFDAALIRIFALDPWGSYALLFFAKTTLILLCVLFFVRFLSQHRSITYFWIVLAAVVPAFVATWHVTGSHTQWVPMAALLLTAPTVARILAAPDVSARHVGFLTLLVVGLTLGKGSIGLAFAVFVGLWLTFTGRLSVTVAVGGTSWITFLLLWARAAGQTGGETDQSSLPGVFELVRDRTSYLSPYLVSLFLLVILLAVLSRKGLNPSSGGIAAALGLATFVILGVAVFASGSSSDAYYYVSGLFAVCLVTVLPVLLRGHPAGDPKADVSTTTLLAVVLALSPVMAESVLSPYGDLQEMGSTLIAANTATYVWVNSGEAVEKHRSVLRSLTRTSGLEHSPDEAGETTFEALREAISEILAENGHSRSTASMFVTQEVFDELVDEYGLGMDTYSGLLLTATTGVSLVFAVPAGEMMAYGFRPYRQSAQDTMRRGSDLMSEVELCRFGRPVIVLHSLSVPDLSMASCPP